MGSLDRLAAVSRALAVVGAMVLAAGAANGNVFNLDPAVYGPNVINLETVHVGDAGNAADTRYAASGAPYYGNDVGFGAVSYEYNIGKYEVTAAQYCDFLNAVAKTDAYSLYNTRMVSYSTGCQIVRSGSDGSYMYSVAPDWANRPANFVGFLDAFRFANWLQNGQPRTGVQDATTTERGAYLLDGAVGNAGASVQRGADAAWAVSSEDEWYKAAYYKGGGLNSGYWEYATRSDIAPSNIGADGYIDPSGHANYANDMGNGTLGGPYFKTQAGEFENSGSAYGTFDQSGNVWEWNDTIVVPRPGELARGERGGAFSTPWGRLGASFRGYNWADYESGGELGFRVSNVPEPTFLTLSIAGFVAIIRRRK